MGAKHKKAKKGLLSKSDAKLIARINAVLAPYNCTAIGLGPKAVGVQGDARSVGYAAVISFPPDLSNEQIAHISNQVTNHVREITRVLRNIAP